MHSLFKNKNFIIFSILIHYYRFFEHKNCRENFDVLSNYLISVSKFNKSHYCLIFATKMAKSVAFEG